MLNTINELIWSAIAWIVSREPIADWLIAKAHKRPYTHILSPDGKSVYMWRGWVANPYDWPAGSGDKSWFWKRMPSIRIHHIKMRDLDRDRHSHPWDARTIILRNWYMEDREGERGLRTHFRGNTAKLKHTDFHRITHVPHDGVWTMFITWKYRHSWGFKTPEGFVPWRKYLGIADGAEQSKPAVVPAAPKVERVAARTETSAEKFEREWREEAARRLGLPKGATYNQILIAQRAQQIASARPKPVARLVPASQEHARKHDSVSRVQRSDDAQDTSPSMMVYPPVWHDTEPTLPASVSGLIGRGGDFAGAGASSSWESSSCSSDSSSSSSSDSSSSDSSSCSSGSD